jgi:hypothetical protein
MEGRRPTGWAQPAARPKVSAFTRENYARHISAGAYEAVPSSFSC